jgi:hypothetical protein
VRHLNSNKLSYFISKNSYDHKYHSKYDSNNLNSVINSKFNNMFKYDDSIDIVPEWLKELYINLKYEKFINDKYFKSLFDAYLKICGYHSINTDDNVNKIKNSLVQKPQLKDILN